jgi:hypothetical protein
MIEHMGIAEDIGGVIPTQSEPDGSVARFQADWGLVDEVLYDLCAKHRGHSDRRVVTAKFALVGRAYAAGLVVAPIASMARSWSCQKKKVRTPLRSS